MDKEKILSLFHKELRQELQSQGYRREETEHVVRHVSLHGERGFIIASHVNEENARKIIQEELDHFKRLGIGFEWKVYSYDKPDYLKELLEEEGFMSEPREALMVMDIHDMPSLLGVDEEIHIKEIIDEKGVRDIISLIDFIWQESHEELGNRLWRDKQDDPDSLFLYGVYDGEKLVSACWMYLEENSSFASLWGGSTLPEYRGKGYYTSLLSIRAKKAAEQGYRFLTVDASPMSQPILQKHGFECLAYSYGCQSPQAEPSQ
ncbi:MULTISPECIES: GNAT family N-acetyltransferase [Sporosarcina]|uniref:GNAT family N-acetyltransferase n=1 Tax=Sporosarcina contaminans TaxID=633403 RepID=A0ABW3TZQ0_9BACL